MNNEKENLRNKVFDLLFQLMYDSGGDGDSALFCDNTILVANEFEKWLDMHRNGYLKRVDALMFNSTDPNGQESISFYDVERKMDLRLGTECIRVLLPLV